MKTTLLTILFLMSTAHAYFPMKEACGEDTSERYRKTREQLNHLADTKKVSRAVIEALDWNVKLSYGTVVDSDDEQLRTDEYRCGRINFALDQTKAALAELVPEETKKEEKNYYELDGVIKFEFSRVLGYERGVFTTVEGDTLRITCSSNSLYGDSEIITLLAGNENSKERKTHKEVDINDSSDCEENLDKLINTITFGSNARVAHGPKGFIYKEVTE